MKILITDKIQKQALKIFEENGFEFVECYDLTPNELKREISIFDAVIVRSKTKLTAGLLENGKKLKVIGRAGVGLDNVDLKKAEEMNIKVLNTPNAPSISVAELTIGLILNLARHISKADETMHCGQWFKSNYMGYLLKGKNLGLIGFGSIGQEVAKRARAFDMNIGIYDVDPSVKKIAKDLGYIVYSSIDDLIEKAQIISLHIPAKGETENIIDERRINLMKKNTVLINTARGNLIDERALIKALKNKELGGAALDVYREEPLNDMELCNCEENLVLTPHLGSQTQETQIQASVDIAEKVSNFLKNY
ncbi:MAG: hydroxyacid dehydrogenase [Promethearchaeota archaeon]|jgi:D-3-phosphoglycerate dehydrogenase